MRILGYNISIKKPKARVYEAADKGRRGKSFRLAGSTGANREIAGALVTLRDRSRHMVRNNGWAKRGVEAITKNTVGEGIQPAPIGELSKTKKVKGLWRRWANTTACDWYGKTTFYGLQELAMRSIAEGGDVLIIRKWVQTDNENPIPLKIQLLEGDHVDHYKNGPNEMGYARLGVQFDNAGRLLGYWIFDYHPGDGMILGSSGQSQFVGKADVLLAFEILRIGQVRGLPIGVASFMKLSDFGDYEDAQLTKQKVAACFTAFVLGSEDTETEPMEDLEPGVIEHLASGETVEFANPPTVGDYDTYSSRIFQGIAAAFGITYEMLTMDYSKVNFTSGRMAKIDVTANFKSWQYNMLVPQICSPVWNWFISASMVVGELDEYISAEWTAPRVQQLDPVKETDAQVKRIQAGLATLSETLRENGREPEEFIEEYKQDVERWKQAGVSIASILESPPSITDTQQDESNSEEMNSTSNVPAFQFGVGGTQSMIEVITSEILSEEQKINILIVWFGMDASKAKNMLNTTNNE